MVDGWLHRVVRCGMATRQALLQGALEAASNGWLVAPIGVNSKIPIRDRSWKQEATSDPGRILELWADTPYNVAGITSRYLVIDVDVAGGKQGAASLERLVNEYGYLDTRVHRTPSGGFHYIFECPPDWSLKPSPLHRDYPGIDLKCGVSYVVLPPSEIDEHKYWVEVDIPPAPAPNWIKTLHEGLDSTTIQVSGRVRLDSLPPGTVGARDVTLTRLAGKLRREGHNATHIVAQLRATNAAWRDPLPMTDLLRIAASAERWQPHRYGGITMGRADTDNAVLVRRVSDYHLLYRAEDARWTVWDGKRWGTDAFRGSYIEETVILLQDLCQGATKDDLAWLLPKISRIKSANGRRGLWYVMSDIAGVTQLNEAFDADPYLLNTRTGVVHLRSGEQTEHDKRLMLTNLADVAYDPTADMSAWEEFVLWCCQDDAEQARWLQVALGQSLIGQQDEHIVIFMFGAGKNGKTQMTEAILRTLGDYGLESTAELLTAKGKDSVHTEMIASLHGKRLVVCPEPEKGSYWAASRVKSLTGGDAVRARHLYGREFTFMPSHTLVVHGNYQPEIRDLSMGFRRRMKLVPFTNTVTADMEVKDLGAKLAGPGVLRWLIEGAIAYATTETLPPSQRVRAATDQYLSEQDQFGRFFEDHLTQDPEGWEAVGDLYTLYRYWAEREGLRFIETKQELSQWLIRHGYPQATRRRGAGSSARGYKGVKIVVQAEIDLPI